MEPASICFVEFKSSKKSSDSPTIQSGLKHWSRRLRQNGFKITTSEDLYNFESSKITILPNPNRKLSAREFENLKSYVINGGSILILLSANGEKGSGSNINFFLEEFGISVNSDTVIRPSFVKPYYHPTQVFVQSGGVTSEDFAPLKTSFVFPSGASLNVIRPAVSLLSSSNIAYPCSRPIAAFSGDQTKGKIAVVGSIQMFTDKWFNKEGNSIIADSLINILLNDQMKKKADLIDADYPDYIPLPDTIALAGRLKSTLQEGENDVSSGGDIGNQFFDSDLFGLDNLLFPDIHETFQKLDVPADSLSLIKPNFETPLPALTPATFPPGFREPQGPSVELFDLDEALSSQRVRLAQIANRCRPDEIQDLEYMLNSAGEALGVTGNLAPEDQNPLGILRYVFNRLVQYKMPR